MKNRAILVAAALVLAACRGNGTTSSPADAGSAPGSQAEAPSSTSPLPAVDVIDVNSGDTVALAGLLPAEKPTLVWFWAPH